MNSLVPKLTQRIPLNLFWCDLPNFGDAFNRSLFRHYGFEPLWTPPETAEVLGIGSILSHVPQSFNGLVLGSGYREARHRFNGLNPTFLATRGVLTRARTLAGRKSLLGDFGILMPIVFPAVQVPSYRLGIIPHCMDKDHPWLAETQATRSPEVLFIEPSRDPERVLADIRDCAHIASASLHGLIAADALGIPNCWIRLSDREVGQGFKFFDYYTSLKEYRLPIIPWPGMPIEKLLGYCRAPGSHVDELKSELNEVMLKFQLHLNNHRDRASSKIRRTTQSLVRRTRRKYRHLMNASTLEQCVRSS